MNPVAERFVLSIKSQCHNKFIFDDEDQLRRAMTEYAFHFNHERPHQGIRNKVPGPIDLNSEGEINIKTRLGGVLRHYHLKPAA